MIKLQDMREEYIKRFHVTHGVGTYDYSEFEYITAKTKSTIGCHKHGRFQQAPYNHSKGQGCPECAKIKINQHKIKSREESIEDFNRVHDFTYDYSKFIGGDAQREEIIICKTHGEFLQKPVNHNSGRGCPKCAQEKRNKGVRKMTTNKLLSIVKEVHADSDYDLSRVSYVNPRTKIEVGCKKHGWFFPMPYNFMKGTGCSGCGRERSEAAKKDNNETFIEKSKGIHNGKVSYDKTKYVDCRTPVILTCDKHGEFEQMPYVHLQNKGCPKCGSTLSKGEYELYEYILESIPCINRDRQILDGKELDIVVPSRQVAIEYNGLYWHSDNKVDRNYHINKMLDCHRIGYKLVQVFEDEWRDKKDIVKSRILNILGVSPEKIFGRKTNIREIDNKEAKSFLETNHIQGGINCKINIGLYYNEELVSVMSFGGLRKNLGSSSKEGVYEMYRFCNKLNTTVVGGASKLLKYFINEYNPKEIISYADRRWSQGELYEKLGFEKVSETVPNYFYSKGMVRENRFNYRKDKLVSLGHDKSKTEKEIMSDLGYYRIYDCGSLKYSYKI